MFSEEFCDLDDLCGGKPVTGKLHVELEAVGEEVVEVLHGALHRPPVCAVGHTGLNYPGVGSAGFNLPMASRLGLVKKNFKNVGLTTFCRELASAMKRCLVAYKLASETNSEWSGVNCKISP